MAHVRTQIRDAFKARLAAVTGVRSIVGARAHAFGDAELPAIQVITPRETIDAPLDDGERERRPVVEVIIFAKGDDGDDDTIDAMAAEVETLIATATGDPWDSLSFSDAVEADLAIGGPAEQTLLMLRTRFRVQFSASDPETIGD